MINSIQRVLKVVVVAAIAIATTLSSVSAATPDIKEKVSISAKDMPIRQFFAEVEKQSNYSFFYSDTVLNGTPNVTVSAKDMPIEQLLHKVFNGTNLTFEVIGSKIAIKVARSVAKIEGGESLLPHLKLRHLQ